MTVSGIARAGERIDDKLEALYRCQALCNGLLRFTPVDEENLSSIEREVLTYFEAATRGLWGEFASRMFRNCLNGNYVLEFFIAKDGKSPDEELECLFTRLHQTKEGLAAGISPLCAGEMKSLVKLGVEVVMPGWIRYDLITRTAQGRCVTCQYYSLFQQPKDSPQRPSLK